MLITTTVYRSLKHLTYFNVNFFDVASEIVTETDKGFT
jgi:hypothetical protein